MFPTATTVPLTGGVALRPCIARGSMKTNKKHFFKFVLCIDTPPDVRVGTSALELEYGHMGYCAMSQRASEFLVAHSTSKKTPLYLGPKHCNQFLK